MEYNQIYKQLYAYMIGKPIINTHCHHLSENFYDDISLDKLLGVTYINWKKCVPHNDEMSRKEYCTAMGCNTYFQYMSKSMEELYGYSITPENWENLNSRLKDKYINNKHQFDYIVNKKCNYVKIILDKYDDPGNNNGMNVYCPTFRIDSFLFGYYKNKTDNNNNCAYDYFDSEINTLEDYVLNMEKAITLKKNNGCCALKLAVAYERNLYFENVSFEKASVAFGKQNATDEQQKWFSDYIVFQIAKIAAKLNLPFQIHTGLGQLEGTRAIGLTKLIKANPNTKFILFHCSFPWYEDVVALLHNFNNVYPDLCWVPLLSTSKAASIINELLDVGDINSFCWGCDTWTVEEGYGALLAFREVLSTALTERVLKNHISIEYAYQIIEHITYNNAKTLYGL